MEISQHGVTAITIEGFDSKIAYFSLSIKTSDEGSPEITFFPASRYSLLNIIANLRDDLTALLEKNNAS